LQENSRIEEANFSFLGEEIEVFQDK